MCASNVTYINRRIICFLVALTVSLTPLLSTANGNVRAAPAYTEVGGPIISDTTWTLANSPYIVVANVEVWQGVTLTIQPGVVVKFNKDRLLQVDGTLIARGNAANPITFTSNQPSSAKGDWGKIEFTVSTTLDTEGNYASGSVLQYCVVEYGGGGAAKGAIEAQSLLIDHCAVWNNNTKGIYSVGTVGSPSRITNNIISNNSAYGDGGGIYASYATISGNTVGGNRAFGGGGIYAADSTISGNTVSDNRASVGSGIYASYSTVSGNSVTRGFSDFGGGIYANHSIVSGNTVSGNVAQLASGGGIYAYYSTISGNTVNGNLAAHGNGGGIYAGASTISGNIISGNSAFSANYFPEAGHGGGIYAGASTVMSNTVMANKVSDATGQGAGVYFFGSGDFLYNTVVGNTAISPTAMIGGVAINGTPQFHHNNIYGNSNYDVVVLSSQDISGTHNYWGAVATVDILAHVYDWYDDSSRGRLLFIPYIQDPVPNAPVPPPQNLRATFAGSSASLSWDAIPSTTTGYGYKVYYDTDASGPPYSGTGAAQGNSPVDVGNATHFTLSGLGGGRIFIVVTSYDTQGRESWYSNEVSWWRIYLPAVLKR